jgi:putative ABC transport system ATP-binding protein
VAEPGHPLLSARGIEKSYQDGDEVLEPLRGVDLDLHGGEWLALVGPSGSGKTSLLHILGGLERPDGGSLVLAARGDAIATADQLRACTSVVFQDFHLIPYLTVRENVHLGRLFARPRSTSDDVAAALESCGATPLSPAYPDQLSGGESQRVALARALAAGPSIVLADEPTGNLDPDATATLCGLFHSLCRDRGIALLTVTHDHGVARRADRVLQLRGGKVVPL